MSKWKCVELGDTCGFTEGRIYEVGRDGTIYYNSGSESSEKLSINGNKAKCWNAKFEKVEEENNMNKPRYFKCTKLLRGEKCFTIGKTYEVTDDKFISDTNFNYAGRGCPNVESIIEFLSEFYEFEEIKKEEEKDMNKFKVGDMIKGTNRGNNYIYTDKDMTKGKVTKVLNRNEVEVEVLEHSSCKRKIGEKYNVLSEKFDLITPPKKSIHLTFDGDTTHAIVKEDGKVVKREKVGLCRGDVYDEAIGVREVIDKLYGKKAIEDAKPKFVKAKVGDTIKIVKGGVRHTPIVEVGDTFIVTSVSKDYVESKHNGFFDKEEEYIIISDKSINVGDKVKLLDGKGRSFMGGWTFGMNEEVGKIATVKEVRKDGKSVSLNEVSWVWDIDCLELVKYSPISEYTTDELLSEIKKRMER